MARLVPAMFLLFGPLPSLAIDAVASPLPSGLLWGWTADRRPAARRLGLWGEILKSAAEAGTEAAQRAAARKAAVELAASAAAQDAAYRLASQGVNEQLAHDLVGKATEAAKAVAEDAKKGALSALSDLEAEACEEALANISQAIKLNMTTAAERALLSGSGSEPEGRKLGGLSAALTEKVAEAVVGGLLEGLPSCEDGSKEDSQDSTAAADDYDATGGLVLLGILGIAGSIYYYRRVHQKRQLEDSATGSKTSQAPDQDANEQAV